MAEKNQQDKKQPEPIAQMDTMTFTGRTLGAEMKQLQDDALMLLGKEQARAKAAEANAAEFKAQVEELTGKVAAKEAKIVELVQYSQEKNAKLSEVTAADQAKAAQVAELAGKLESLTVDLGVARMLLKDAKATSIPGGVERLPGGGIRLAIELDVDEAAPIESWAESAGEDLAVYAARTVKDALVTVTQS